MYKITHSLRRRKIKRLFHKRQSERANGAAAALQIARSAIADPTSVGLNTLAAAFREIVADCLWHYAGTKDAPFKSFGQFAVAPRSKGGLGIRCRDSARLLRQVLLDNRLFAAWTEVLELIATLQGRPAETLVNGEDFKRFYKVSTSRTSLDRLLPALKRHHPEFFAKVCEDGISPRSAAIEAGLLVVPQPGRLRYGVWDMHAFVQLPAVRQSKLLREVFQASSSKAQCELIAQGLEPRLGPGLARTWQAETLERASQRAPNKDAECNEKRA